MKLRLLVSSIIATACAVSALAQDPWFHVYRSDSKFNSVPVDSLESVSVTPAKGSDAATELILNIIDGTRQIIPMDAFSSMTVAGNIPEFHITTNEWIDDIHDKKTWHDSKITIRTNGFPGCEALDGKEVQLRGRGNSTLGMPKKPYRIKFSKKQAVHSDLRSAKNYVLLANYIDNSLMRNTVAFKVAQLLDLPYTPHAVPVNVWLNGLYRGSYVLTEKTGLNSGNIHDIEETEGVLLELDTNIDPSDTYFPGRGPLNIPVAIKDPDFAELEEDGEIASADDAIAAWQEKYMTLERTLAGETDLDWTDLIDLESAVRYVMTFHFCGNLELKHPKSCFIHATDINSKFAFGPIWDFDWAFTYDNYEGAQSPSIVTFGGANSAAVGKNGSMFFMTIITDPRFQERFGEVWDEFMAKKYPELLDYFDEYAETIRPSAAKNGQRWPQDKMTNGAMTSANIEYSVSTLRNWIAERANFISTAPNFGLYEEQVVTDLGEIPEGMTEVKLSTDNVTASDPDPEEGPLADLFDGSTATHYHSDWHSYLGHDPKYGSYLDITLPEAVTSIALDMHLRMGENLDHTGVPDYVDLYISNDGETWEPMTQIAEASTKFNFDNKNWIPVPEHTGVRFGSYTASHSFKYLRFAVTRSRKGSLTDVSTGIKDIYQEFVDNGWMSKDQALEQSNKERTTYWYLSELRLYAK